MNTSWPLRFLILVQDFVCVANWFFSPDANKYVKPSNHEQKKTKKYRTNISRRKNIAYDADADTYTCANGKTITFDSVKKNKSQRDFEMETSVYSCKDCAGCRLKEKRIRACGNKKPLAERRKVICVSKRFARQRAEMEERINTNEGTLIRMNRRIQAKGRFHHGQGKHGISSVPSPQRR